MIYANRFAFGHRAESVRVTLASTVYKLATGATRRVVEILPEGTSANTRIRRNVAGILSLELSAKTFALLLRFESVRVSFAAAINERLTGLIPRVVVVGGDVVVATARINGLVTDWTLRDCLDGWRRRDFDGRRCYRWDDVLPAGPLAGVPVLETVLVALAAAVLEFEAGVRTVIVVVLSVEAVARTDHLGQGARILNISASVIAFVLAVEVVPIALTATVPELFANTLVAVVEPFDLIVGARSMFLGKEAEVWSELDLFGRRNCCECRLTPIKAILLGLEIIFVTAATAVVELSTLLFVGIVVPSLGVVVAFSQKRGQETDVLLDFSRAIRLACVSRFEIIFISTATGIIEWHASILRLVKVPSRFLLPTFRITLVSRQQATISSASWLQTLLMTGDLGGEVVVVRFASAIPELFAGLQLGIEVPPGEVTFAGTRFLRLFAGIQIVGGNAKLFAFFLGLELVRISKTTTMNELTTLLSASVIIPRREVSNAGSGYLW